MVREPRCRCRGHWSAGDGATNVSESPAGGSAEMTRWSRGAPSALACHRLRGHRIGSGRRAPREGARGGPVGLISATLSADSASGRVELRSRWSRRCSMLRDGERGGLMKDVMGSLNRGARVLVAGSGGLVGSAGGRGVGTGGGGTTRPGAGGGGGACGRGGAARGRPAGG